jgi:hypothetical protein
MKKIFYQYKNKQTKSYDNLAMQYVRKDVSEHEDVFKKMHKYSWEIHTLHR